jgi:hypothetical protein
MGFALVALILGIVALTVQPKSIQVLEQDMLKLKTLEQDMLKLKTMPTTLEKLDMPVNVFKGTNYDGSLGSLLVCSDGKYVTIKAVFMLVSTIQMADAPNVTPPSTIGQVERSLGNSTHDGSIFYILNFLDRGTRSLHPCLLRIDDKRVSLTPMLAYRIPDSSLIMGGGVFPIYFEPKEKPKP